MSAHPLTTHQRHVHLDFHTSPFIGDVGSEFDATAFAETFRRAHVNSVNVFAKCHHGQSYYPTKIGVQHPALNGRDLLGEQIEALHRAGLRAPIYTTIGWEEDVAFRFPQWRQIRHDGRFSQLGRYSPTNPPGQAAWHFLNPLHPDYQDFIEAHIRELFARYDVDGLWIDIVCFDFDGQACWSEPSIKFREKHGLLSHDPATQARFESLAVASFTGKFTRIIQGLKKDATIIYNTPKAVNADARFGASGHHADQTQWEIESLPSGFWGYQHFPRLARTFGHWGKPWLGMTGRFQKMWGDFGGLKPQAALEYECFRSQALGGGNCVGDQMPPRGTLDAGAYDLIGAVFAQTAAAEPFYAGSSALPQIGIVAPGAPELSPHRTDLTIEGAIQMCDEAHYDTIVLNDASTFDGLDLVILPDSVIPTPALETKLAAYLRAGGKLLFSGTSGFRADGSLPLPGIDLRRIGSVEQAPTYWRTQAAFHPALARSDRVLYAAGEVVEAGAGVTVLAERVLPYFKRSELKFSSHFQTPPQAAADRHAAILAGENWVYFADPIFGEYRQSGNIAARDAWKAAMHRLIGPAPFGDGLPSTVLCTPRRRGDDLLLTLLHYIPTRKALDIDMIEERSSFAGELLRLPPAAKNVCVFNLDGSSSTGELPRAADGTFILPAVKGRLLLAVPGFFTP